MNRGSASFTITDLIDNATYIYYAEDSLGKNASLVPSENKGYIGFYNGPSIPGGPPETPETLNPPVSWSKYTGSDGKTGRGIKKTAITYQYSNDNVNPPSGKWSSTILENLEDEKFLWTRTILEYDDNSISEPAYSVSSATSQGQFLQIEPSQSEVIKTLQKNTTFMKFEHGIDFIPRNFQFYLRQDGIQKLIYLDISKYEPLIYFYNDPSSTVGLSLEFLKKYEGIIATDLEGKNWSLNFEKLLKNLPIMESSDSNMIKTLMSGLLKLPVNVFEILIIPKDKYQPGINIPRENITDFLCQKRFFIYFGNNLDDAKFSITSRDISGAVNNAGFVFNEDGLKITNGNFQITHKKEKAEEKILYADSKTGNLVIKGEIRGESGYFKGKLIGASGEFSGRITAKGGILEEITIGQLNEKHIKIDKEGIYSSNFSKINKQGFMISTDGSVIANNIKIGKQAEISDFLKIGTNCFIYNPSLPSNKGKFIEIGDNFLIDQNGNGYIGKIKISGETSSLKGKNWEINSDFANFSNIEVSGKINSAVFSTDSIQLSNSNFIYKDGIFITEENIVTEMTTNKVLTLKLNFQEAKRLTNKILFISTRDQKFSFLGKSSLNENYLKIESISGDIWNNQTRSQIQYEIIFVLDDNLELNFKERKIKNWLIGVNSSNADINNLSLYSNAIGFSELKLIQQENGKYTLQSEPKIILGKIPVDKIDSSLVATLGSQTYGLYAQSVYLTGTLATKYLKKEIGQANNLYAGVNTLNGATFNINFSNFSKDEVMLKDKSPIVFWAGAQGTDQIAIQKSPFQVTSNGTLYAQQGYFEGSILTNATVKASTIETATIIGSNKQPGESALTIQDVYNGISFKGRDTENNTDITFLELTKEGLKLNVPIIFGNEIKNNSGAYLQGLNSEQSQIIVKDSSISEVIVEPSGIGFADNNHIATLEESSLKIKNEFNKDGQNLSFYDKEILLLNLSKNGLRFSEKTQVKNGISFGEFEKPTVEYKMVSNGMDIYVYE